jgi:putative endonuclease
MADADKETISTVWWLYLLECKNGSIYTGITTDVVARYAKHLGGKGAKYTRANPPVRILKTVQCADHSAALKAEHATKRMSAAQKRAFCAVD